MAYKPPKQSIDNNDLKNIPSSEAIYEAFKEKIDQPAVSGTAGQLLQLDGYVNDPDGDPEPVTSWVNPPASGANTTLSNLTAPTAVNQDLNLNAGKVLGTNGISIPSYTNTAGFQNDIFFRAGSIATYIRPDSAPAGGQVPWKQTSYLTNAYIDNQVAKRIVQGPAARINISTGTLATVQPSITFDYAVQGNAGTDITWVNMTSWNVGAISTNGTFNSSASSNVFDKAVLASGFQCNTDNQLSIGLSQANRPRAGYFGKQVTIGQKDLTTGTRVSPAALYVRIPDMESTGTTSNVNDTNTITLTGSGGGNIRFAVGDYIQLQGLSTIARVLSATNAGASPVTYTLDRNIGDGTSRNVLRYDAGFIVSKSDNTQIFEIDYQGNCFIDSAVVINDSGADKDTRIEGDTDANLVFADASTDRVGIGTATPAEKLEVAGAVLATEYRVPNYRLDPHTHDEGTETTDFTINWSNGAVHTVTLNAAGPLVITMNNPVNGGAYSLRIIQGATPGTVTWPANVKWPGGTPPTLSTNTGDVDLVNLLYFDDGGGNTYYYATSALAFA